MHRSLRVLVVDDCPDSAHILAELVRVWGHEARAASDGPTAVATARAFSPDVVLLDLGMPETAGGTAGQGAGNTWAAGGHGGQGPGAAVPTVPPWKRAYRR